jgi:putative membrane-bound dehydrogenase-like protein
VNRYSIALLVLAIAPGFSARAADPAYKAGVATTVITPQHSMWMAGYASRTKPSEGKLHDLHAKAVCLEDAVGKRLVLVTTDLIGIPRHVSVDVSAEVEKRYGIKRADLMLTASHTHSGPVVRENLLDMYGLSREEMDKVEVYTKKLKTDLVELVGRAVKNLEPATLTFAHGTADFAMNRREPTEKGIINGVNRTGPVDHTVPVLVVAGKDGKPRAIVFGYACHNTTLAGQEWCGDYAGYAQIGIEKAFPGAAALFWTGCGADANPQPRRTVELCERHGKELADAVIAAVKGERKPISGNFTAKYETISLRFESVPTKEKLAADTLSKTTAVKRRAERLLRELEVKGKIADSYPHYPVQTWTLGDFILWVALGGEVVIDYNLRLKKELPTTRTLWVTGYANDVMAYIPSARMLKEGGYEADSSQIYYGMPGKWSSSIEDLIVTKVKQLAGAADELPKPPGPLSPQEELATFRIDPAFKIELVAHEPDIVDPVAMCFDAKGRLFVCEMRGYPNGGVGTGHETRGRIKCLTDADGDGVFERSVTFAEGLRFPMGITPYKNGIIVAVAPDIIYLEDTDGDGKADQSTVLYTGFNLANIQQMVNSLQWGLDNWIYGCAGSDGGTVTCPEKPGTPPVSLRARGFRFRPAVPGSLEPTSGGGQYGLSPDDHQRWFTATNSQHLRQIVLPENYLKRNPYLAVAAVTIDIPEHGAAARVFRISPFEPWRVERTARRAGGADSSRFPGTELVPGGFITSACSPLIYTAGLFPEEFRGNNFVCDPANNLIHREQLVENGAAFKAVRAYPDREFLASTDNWFRPVHLSIGPDGAVYVLDFYREVIETPLSLPDDIKKQLNLESRDRGRIWRIAPKEFKPTAMPDFTRMSGEQLANELVNANSARRITAQRLLVESQCRQASPRIRELLATSTGKPARVNLLWTLAGLNDLKRADIVPALTDPEAGVRENALRLIEALLERADDAEKRELTHSVLRLLPDSSPRVRFQLAFTAGFLPRQAGVEVLAELLVKDEADRWIQTAALSSAKACGAELLDRFHGALAAPNAGTLARLAAMVGAGGSAEEIARVVAIIAGGDEKTAARDSAMLDGLGQGMRSGKLSLPAWLARPPAGSETAVQALTARFAGSAKSLNDESLPAAVRVGAANLLASAPFDIAGPALAEALAASTPGDVQLAAVRALAAHADATVASLFIRSWKGQGPAARALVIDAMLARPDRIFALLAAIERKEIAAADLSQAQVQQLKAHPNAKVKARAGAVLRQAIDSDRAKVVAAFAKSLERKGDAKAGRAVFQKHCAACHKLDGVGHEVGPNLLAVLGNKSGEDLLIALFDPNREVDPRYRTYQIGTADERVITGIIVAETPTSITLRRAEGIEEVILRANLALFRATTLSLMPVGLEKDLKPQDVADLFAYLRSASK